VIRLIRSYRNGGIEVDEEVQQQIPFGNDNKKKSLAAALRAPYRMENRSTFGGVSNTHTRAIERVECPAMALQTAQLAQERHPAWAERIVR